MIDIQKAEAKLKKKGETCMPYEQRNEMDHHRPNPFPGDNERTYDQDNVSWSPGEKLTLPIVQKKRGWFLIACLFYEGIGFTLNELLFFYRIWLHGMTPLSWGIVCVRGLATILNVLGVCAIWNWKKWGAVCFAVYIFLIQVSTVLFQQDTFSLVVQSTALLLVVAYAPLIGKWKYFN